MDVKSVGVGGKFVWLAIGGYGILVNIKLLWGVYVCGGVGWSCSLVICKFIYFTWVFIRFW
jgi:hypothetical protein